MSELSRRPLHRKGADADSCGNQSVCLERPESALSMPKAVMIAIEIMWAIFIALLLLSVAVQAHAQALPEDETLAATMQLPPADFSGTYQVFLPVMLTEQVRAGEVEPPVDPPSPDGCQLNEFEAAIANLMMTNLKQQRPEMHCNPILAQVARQRAEDMGKRGYFSHKTPDGLGPNELVRAAGFVLPDWYDTSRGANNIESIAAGYGDPNAAWDAWMKSSHHRAHLLAEDKFWREQVQYGIGYAYIEGSPYGNYWVVLTAPTPK